MIFSQEHLFFESQGRQLFAVLFLPDPEIPATEGRVICSPFAEEKKSSQRMLVDLAGTLAAGGRPVLLFDYLACGDSEGEFKEATITIWIQNTQDAVNLLKTRSAVEKVGLIGLRLGCYMALSALNESENGSTAVFIEPVFDPGTYFKHALRQKLMKELITDGKISSRRDELINQLAASESIDFDGYEISPLFYADLQRQKDLTPTLKDHKTRTLIIHVTPTGKTARNFQKIMNVASSNKKLRLKQIRLDPFWDRIDNPVYQPVIDEIVRLEVASSET
jgi:exosortase A-associated hydrolase 2